MLFKKQRVVLIDASNIIPGKGGAGGGVAIYAKELLTHLDNIVIQSDLVIFCFLNEENKSITSLNNIKIKRIGFSQSNVFTRLIWLNILLPYYCLKYRAGILHRCVAELPLIKVCRQGCTFHDFMAKFYLEHAHLNSFLGKKERIKFRLLNFITNISIRLSDFLIVQSGSLKNEIEKFSIKSGKKVFITPAGIQRLDPIEKKIISEKPEIVRIIVVAGFYPHKGQLYVLELAQQLRQKGIEDFIVTFRGNPAYRDYHKEISDKIISLGLEKHVFFAQFTQLHDIREIYKNQDIFLLLSEYEGFGFPVLEAQQMGLPVICSDIPVFREVLGDSPVFLNLSNIEASLPDIISFIKSKEEQKIVMNNGYENVKKYSWQKMANETLEVFMKHI